MSGTYRGIRPEKIGTISNGMNNVLIIEKDQKIVATVLIDNADNFKLIKAEKDFREEINQQLKKIKDTGAELRQCVEEGSKITEVLAPVKPNEVNYLYALEDEFARAGFRAEVIDPIRAELWELVRASDTDLAFQEAVLRNIRLLKDDLISDIKKEFEEYAK